MINSLNMVHNYTVQCLAKLRQWKCLQKSCRKFTRYCRLNTHKKPKISADVVATEDIRLIRNIGIMAHIDAGKTTTTERMLYYSGFTRHLGDVDRGDTVTDYLEEERQRGITIVSAAVTFYWNKHKINLIDTPGHVDFTVEVERSLRVLDGAIAVLDASAGVEAQTVTVWRQADRHKVPRLIFLNKMDKAGANFNMCLKSIKERLHIEPIPINLPIGKEKTFTGVVDLVTLEQLIWDQTKSNNGQVYDSEKIDLSDSSPSVAAVSQARSVLIGHLAEVDDKIAEYILNDTKLENIPAVDIVSALRKVTLSGKAVLVLCGSAKKNIAVQPLMNAIIGYLPNPLDIKHHFLDFYGESLCALAFKIVHDKHRGALTYIRIYGGILKAGANFFNVNLQLSEEVGTHDIYQVNADEYKPLKEVGPGNIVCVSGLEKTRSGDTLTSTVQCANKAALKFQKHEARGHHDSHVNQSSRSDLDLESEQEDIEGPVLAGLEIPSPVFFCSIEAPSVSKQRDMDRALELIQREDPSVQVNVDNETGQTILSGMGELHLEIVKHRLEKEFGINPYLGPLQIAYREMLGDAVDHALKLENMIGKLTNSVTLAIRLEPNLHSPVFRHVNYKGEYVQTINHKQQSAINNGVKTALNYGPLLHSQVMNVDVYVTALSIAHKTTLPFIQAAASDCVRHALAKAHCYLMEPMMAMQIQTNSAYLHAVQVDLLKRRGEVKSLTSQQDTQIVHALAPLSELVGYSTALRTLSSGTANFSMELDHYSKLSQTEQKKVIDNFLF